MLGSFTHLLMPCSWSSGNSAHRLPFLVTISDCHLMQTSGGIMQWYVLCLSIAAIISAIRGEVTGTHNGDDGVVEMAQCK